MPSKEGINQRSNQAIHGNSGGAGKIHRICRKEKYYSWTPQIWHLLELLLLHSTNLAFMEKPANRMSLLRKKKILLKKVHKCSHLQFATRQMGVTTNLWIRVLCYDKEKIEHFGETWGGNLTPFITLNTLSPP